MTCPDLMDQLFIRVHRPVRLDSGVLVEGEKTIRLCVTLAGPWYLSWLYAWLGPWWPLARGHRHPMDERPEPLPMHRFATSKQI